MKHDLEDVKVIHNFEGLFTIYVIISLAVYFTEEFLYVRTYTFEVE